ncbi:hypothetical protein WJX84_006801 [Apatococcus fuscideae]|uniref:S1 motif domain-containing protein n=1 Tax=Apatococcus fuscideae TaxID=2026836 RepID=A0AAW1SQG0_9CHLO
MTSVNNHGFTVQELKEKYLGKELEVYMTELKSDNMTVVMNQRLADVERMERKCRTGTLHWGTVDHIHPSFGAYIILDDPFARVVGMLHISSISQEHVNSVTDVFQVGERVRVLVKDVRRPALSRIDLATHVLEKEPGQIFTDKEGVYANADAVLPVWQDVVQSIIANRRALGRGRSDDNVSYGRDPYGQSSRSFGGQRRDSRGGDNGASWGNSNSGRGSSEPDDSFWDPM